MKTCITSTRSIALLALNILLVASWISLGAAPRLEPLLRGKWPEVTRGTAYDVHVAGHYA